jgi:hypothetical protein
VFEAVPLDVEEWPTLGPQEKGVSAWSLAGRPEPRKVTGDRTACAAVEVADHLRSGARKTLSTASGPVPPRDQACGRPSSKEAVMAETYSGEFYCVKCKEKREASGEVHVNDKGTRMAKAKCPVCGTNLNRILGKA